MFMIVIAAAPDCEREPSEGSGHTKTLTATAIDKDTGRYSAERTRS
jgi:hypothetical protein